jgi:hypothetical protein
MMTAAVVVFSSGFRQLGALRGTTKVVCLPDGSVVFEATSSVGIVSSLTHRNRRQKSKHQNRYKGSFCK